MPRRYLPRRHLDESAEAELGSTGTVAPVLTDERVESRLAELLITRGPESGNGNRGAVPRTSVTRLQRLAGNRAVADRLGGRGQAIQRSRNRTGDEEEPIPESAQAGPVEAAPEPEPGAAPSAQAGPVEAAPEPEPGAAPSAQAGPVEAMAAPNAEEAAKAGIEEAARKPAGVGEEPTGVDKIVQDRISPIVGEGGRILPGADIAAEEPVRGGPEGGRILPGADIAAEEPVRGGPEGGRILPGADIAAEEPVRGGPEGSRALPDAEIEPKAPLPGAPEGGANAPVEVPGPAGGGGPGVASPGTEVPATPTPEPGGPAEPIPSEEGPSPTAEPPEGASLPASDQAQIATLNTAGARAAVVAAKAGADANKVSAVAVPLAAIGFALAVRQLMTRAVQWRSRILDISPKVVSTATRMLTGLRTSASLTIQNIALKVKSTADAAKGVLAWARKALSAGLATARSIAQQLRSALGGVGDAVRKSLSGLLAPARTALERLQKAASEVMLEGIKQVRVAAARAVAFVKEEVGTRLEAALTKVVNLVRAVVKSALLRAQRAKAEIILKINAARAPLRAVVGVARAMIITARSRAKERIGASIALLTTARANGQRQLRTGRGRRVFRQNARMWLEFVRALRTRAIVRFASGMASVKDIERGGNMLIGAMRAEARANHLATRTALTDLETVAVNAASEFRASVGDAAATATGAVDGAAMEGEMLIREIAGDGDRDARELQGLINRAGK